MDDQLREKVEEIIVRYNARRHDNPNGFSRKDPRPPIAKAIEEILALVTSATAEALEASEIEHVKFLEELEVETAQKLVEGRLDEWEPFIGRNVSKDFVQDRIVELNDQLTKLKKGES